VIGPAIYRNARLPESKTNPDFIEFRHALRTLSP
jgi:hypothetical protein